MGLPDPIFFGSPEEWSQWLDAHGTDEDEVAVGFWKRGTDQPTLTWDEAVDEALCRGWIDGIRRTVDGDRYQIRFTPRRPRSKWSAKNLRRVAELLAAGRMRAPGIAVFEARDTNVAGYSSERAEPAALSPDYQRQLDDSPKARAFFDAQPPGYQRTALYWVMSAKREETRLRRLTALIEDSASGRKIKQLYR